MFLVSSLPNPLMLKVNSRMKDDAPATSDWSTILLPPTKYIEGFGVTPKWLENRHAII